MCEVTDLNLSPLEIEILILESAQQASRQQEQRTFARVVDALEVWEAAKDSLDKLNRLIAEKRDEFVRRAV